MSVDPLRHLAVFSPEQFGDAEVAVIGAGALGSAVTLEIAKLGVKNIHVWDFDTVESHNLANQAYGIADVDRPKVEALQRICKDYADVDITIYNEALTPEVRIVPDIVFLAVDSMKARRDIVEQVFRNNFHTRLVIEMRMDAKMGLIYSFNPNNQVQYQYWLDGWYPDAEVEVGSACRAVTSIGATAKLVASLAVWQFLKAAKGEDVDSQVTVCVAPLMIQTRNFAPVYEKLSS